MFRASKQEFFTKYCLVEHGSSDGSEQFQLTTLSFWEYNLC